MKFLLIYFTGTYNTRYLTDRIKVKLQNKGHIVNAFEINCDTEFVNTDGYDFVGFGYPIYGFNSPRPFDKYVKKLKFTKDQKYFIYKNSGETFAMNNASSVKLIRVMKRRKMRLVGEYHFVMPYNIHFPYEKQFVREILEKDNKLEQIMIYNLENAIDHRIKSKFIYNLASFFVAIQKISGDINSFFYKVDKNKCINCMKCVNSCPEKNIYVNKKGVIKFHHHCDMCMRCSFYCPKDAIKIGFLDWWGWRVNGDYKLKEIEKNNSPIKSYVQDHNQGFFKCFIKTFNEIDTEYEKIFDDKNVEQEVAITK